MKVAEELASKGFGSILTEGKQSFFVIDEAKIKENVLDLGLRLQVSKSENENQSSIQMITQTSVLTDKVIKYSVIILISYLGK